MTLTAERLREELVYDPDTGLFRRARDKGGGIKAGDRAGGKNGAGYVFIRVDGVKYQAHRLAWLYVHGEWPPADVDHCNRVKSDNRIGNLRLATDQQNLMNVPKRITNTSGYKGVSFRNKKLKRPWRATIRLNGEQVELGWFATAEEAADVYRQAAIMHYGEFARTE